MDSVEGFSIPKAKVDSTAVTDNPAPPQSGGQSSSSPGEPAAVFPGEAGSEDDTSAIPEPATLLLIATGLGTMYALRKRKM
jgi:hypothetical protein